jgi:cytidylate kinase
MATDSAIANEPAMVPVITVDGPSGSGKGTLAELLAARLGWQLLDSGALYRIVAVAARDAGLSYGDTTSTEEAGAIAALAGALDIDFSAEGVLVGGADFTTRIRVEAASIGASQVAALPPVRAAILDLQRAMRRLPGLVADGRDMGTVVFADAPLKIFLDASAEIRAERRYNQLKNKGLSVNLRDLLASIQQRDERDRGRAASPLVPAQDAILIDSTIMSIDAVLERVYAEAKARSLV